MISIIGVLQGPEDLEVQSVFRLDAESTVSNGHALDLRAELVDKGGRILASGVVYGLVSHASCGCGCTGGDHD